MATLREIGSSLNDLYQSAVSSFFDYVIDVGFAFTFQSNWLDEELLTVISAFVAWGVLLSSLLTFTYKTLTYFPEHLRKTKLIESYFLPMVILWSVASYVIGGVYEPDSARIAVFAAFVVYIAGIILVQRVLSSIFGIVE